MKKTIHYRLYSGALGAISIFLLLSCMEKYPVILDSEEKESFFYSEREGIYSEGKPVFILDKYRHQLSINPKRLQYRIQTDSQDTCLNIIMDKKPKTTGVHITVRTEFILNGNPGNCVSVMECSRILDNRYWLWDSGAMTGIILSLN